MREIRSSLGKIRPAVFNEPRRLGVNEVDRAGTGLAGAHGIMEYAESLGIEVSVTDTDIMLQTLYRLQNELMH